MNKENVIYKVFEEQVARNPEHTAVLDEKRTITRGELDRMADTIALLLPVDAKRVGIVMEHSVEMIASIFAVLKKGAAYVPVEPDFPEERIHFMMNDAGVDCIITQEKFRERLNGFEQVFVERGLEDEGSSIVSQASKDSLAYVLYTSGSTGTPKGVSVENHNVCHYVRAFCNEFHPSEQDIMMQYSVCSFDIFVEEVFTTLLSGATLAIPSTETKSNMESLMSFVETYGVTMMSGFPYLLQEMNSLKKLPDSLRLLISGGDVLRANYVDNLVKQLEVYNTYGPSETTVCASYFRCNGAKPLADGTYPIGTEVLGSSIEILDEQMNPLKAGQVGEICIYGEGVSHGYIGNREKENKAFVTLANGTRMYHSGDLGYVLPDGNLAFLHRKDTQVMILGKRVEPDEVESVLCGCQEVKQAKVKSYIDEQNLSYMVAYVVANGTCSPVSKIRKSMAKRLPTYMIPEFFIQLANMPLTPNGKVDSGALPVVLKAGNL